jgi:hypothetical protein
MTGTRRFPLDRLCCAVALLRTFRADAREWTLTLIEAQISREHAQAVRSALSSSASRPARRTRDGSS